MIQNAIKPEVSTFYDKQTSTFSYVVKDPQSNACAIIDSVLNLDCNSGRTSPRYKMFSAKYLMRVRSFSAMARNLTDCLMMATTTRLVV
jgi:hypothetical protein